MLCSSSAPSLIDAEMAFPIPAAITATLIAPPILPPSDFPAASVSPPTSFCSIPPIPFADGIICTYAFASSVFPTISPLFLSAVSILSQTLPQFQTISPSSLGNIVLGLFFPLRASSVCIHVSNFV